MKILRRPFEIAVFTVAIAGVMLVGTSGPSEAQPCALFASEAADIDRDLLRLDPATGEAMVIGDIGGETTGLAFHPATGALYGSTASIQLGPQNFSPGSLLIIDPATGAGTEIGSFNLPGGGGGSTLADIAFDPTTGILYGWRSQSAGDLYRIDLDTGAATLVGESGLDLSGGMGLTFGPGNQLFLAGEGTEGLLRTIDKNTGLPISSVQLSGYGDDQNINSLAFDGEALFGVTSDDHDLIRINPVTGVITIVGPAGEEGEDAVDGIAFQCVRTAPAPALALPAAAALALGLLWVGMRRRDTSARNPVR
ncbi:MAG TPA: hypothetical protein VEB21_00580 [Terriglobales bacterium]|nr:hypothetical protein [Terriglobales bacterium]